jgi:glycosyltransferase involved in cell wall biosynthesis
MGLSSTLDARSSIAPDRIAVKKLVGIIGSGAIARDPFQRSAWSGSSYRFFTELDRQGMLLRAFGVEAPALKRYLYMARNIHPRRSVWREHFYMDVGYRRALTAEIHKRLQPEDYGNDFLQIGAMYDVGSLVNGNKCYSYHDGNLAELLRGFHVPKGLSRKKIDRALAFERQACQGCAKVFTMSEYLRQSFIHDYGVPAERVSVIGAGINLEVIPEPSVDKRYDNRQVLFIGVDFARKGGWELLQAFRGVSERFPDARLHLVGPRELTIPAGQDRGVVYHGFLNKNEPADRARLLDLLNLCSLFVMPSLYEPFGIAPLEAMVYQMPALVTNRWALKELVTPGQTGDLVECGSVDELQTKLQTLLADPESLRRMGTAGRQRVLDHYTWDKVIGRLKTALAD